MMKSYGICPRCSNSAIFGVPVQFMGTATIQNGQLDITDYTFQGNSTPEIHAEALVCGNSNCNAKFPIKEVLTVETCELCNTGYYEKDMRTHNGQRICVNCLAMFAPPPAPVQDAPQPGLGQQSGQSPPLDQQAAQQTQPDVMNMTQEQLVAYAMQLQASINAANGIVVTAPEEDENEQLNFIPGPQEDLPVGNYDDATEGMPIDPQMGLGMPPAAPAEAGTAANLPFQAPNGEGAGEGSAGSTGPNIPIDAANKDTAAGGAGEVAPGSEVHQQNAAGDISYIATVPGLSIPSVIQGIIDPLAFPFQPTSTVNVQPNQ